LASRRDDRCGARVRRRATPDAVEPHVPETEALGLTAAGQALMDALRDDPRYRDLIADPFGEHGPAPAA
jgi:hypothetical protein